MKIFFAAITHKHGTNFYVARSEDVLTTKLATYCTDWWAIDGPSTPMPSNDREIVDDYFQFQSDQVLGESLETQECELEDLT